ncbi:MAG TPA: iron-sulfur cluster co-chaperone HscB C-terminal domain-containing protein, partial [Polyangiales bacterium]|nr:iron-sulfur cluster co-chaperone HscB C-terminal domain-containing protein [Polyangiales bacterium]
RLGGTVSETGQQADPELLFEVMELREGLAEAKTAKDAVKRASLTAEVRTKQTDALGALREAFAVLQDAKNPGALYAAASALSRLRYYKRFLDEVALQEDEAD